MSFFDQKIVMPPLRKYLKKRFDLSTSFAIITVVTMLVSIPLLLSFVQRGKDLSRPDLVRAAVGQHSSLTLSITANQQLNTPFDAIILLNTDSALIRGVDIVIDYDPSILEFQNVTPISHTTTTLKTFLPIKSDGTFDATKIIADAKDTKQIKFSSVTFDSQTKTTTSPFNGLAQLAILKFKPVKLGTTIVSFNSTFPSTTDTNIVAASNPPYDLLIQHGQLISASVTILSPTATPTSTPIPTLTKVPEPTTVPSPTLQPTPTSSVESQNLLTDPGFENNGAGWQKTTFGGRSIVSTQAHSGTKSQQHITHAQYPREVYQDVSITSGLEYAFSGWIKTNNISGGSLISVQWLTEAVALSQSPSESQLVREDIIGTVTGSTNWSNLAKGLLAPADSRIARFRLYSKTQDTEGAAWFDDLSIIKR